MSKRVLLARKIAEASNGQVTQPKALTVLYILERLGFKVIRMEDHDGD